MWISALCCRVSCMQNRMQTYRINTVVGNDVNFT
jgi:hypothetical protein